MLSLPKFVKWIGTVQRLAHVNLVPFSVDGILTNL